MKLEYPPHPEGTAMEQLHRLWVWLYRQVELLNADRPAGETKEPAQSPWKNN